MQHDELELRRQNVARVAAELIASEGLDAATVRRIAAELGCSTTMITHYFDDKDELLLLAYQYIARQGAGQVAAILAEHPGDLVEVLVSMTITGADALRRWRVYMAFWERAGHDPVFAEEQRQWVEHTLDTVCAVIRSGYGERDNSRAVAQQLVALVHGIALQSLFDTRNWPQEAIREALAAQVNFLLGPAQA